MNSVGEVPAAIDLDQLTLDSFAGRPVAVLGLARSGVALARFLADQGARVTVYDGRPPSELGDSLAQLRDRAVEAVLGPDADPATLLARQALVCTSPSVNSRYPTTEPRLRAALAAVEQDGRVPVVSEVDLFLRLCPSSVVGVTGTKGKTTTSSLSAAVLGASGAPAVLGGNIGTPLVERLPELTPEHRVVLELSELQLPTLSRGTDVAVYTHVTSDHLDRHGTLDAYRRVKRRLAELTPRDGVVVLNAEDPVSADFADATDARVMFYRRITPLPGGVGVVDGWIVAGGVKRLGHAGGGDAMTGPAGRILSLDDVRLPGAHNTSNVLAAVAVGLLYGVAPDAIRQAVAGFGGVEHRLETVAVVDGVRFVNDSMGTQPDAVVAALRAFPPPIVLIAGGRTKGLSIDYLADVVAERAGGVVLMGESGPQLGRAFAAAGAGRLEYADSLDDAVRQAASMARDLAGRSERREATVLLSPAAASFDMFVDYAARGQAFRDAVGRLSAERGGPL
ncbi:UDP-N-acetylmuramoyl-L-alanine--D-glutamate ligase [soil metagenome]